MEIKDMNIYQKMIKATEEIQVVAKKLNVGTGNNSYKAVGEREVLNAVKPIEIKYGIYSFPYERKILSEDRLVFKNKYGETENFVMRVETTYRFVNSDKPDEYIDIKTYGDGVDSQDKAPGKAMTYADKYGLLKAYKIETGDDPDKDPSGTTIINYNAKLTEYIKQQNLDIKEIATKYKLNGKTKNERFKEVLEELKGENK